MYETFYGLAGNAFRLTPDCRFKFPHASYTNAADTLLQATKRGEGFALLTGAPGTGKTTLINDLATQLESDGYFVGKVVNSRVDADDLLQLIGFAFGLQADAFSKAGLLAHLKDQLKSKGRHRRPAILIIDEAQDLTAAALEQLRLLCNLTAEYGPLVQIILSGQERLWERLGRPECEQILQLVVASCRLDPLSPAETSAYISQALQLVNWKGDPEISADALRLVHERTGGVPRLINLTVGRLLLHGSLIAAHRLDAQDVETILVQLGNDHPNLLSDTSEELLPSEPAAAQALLPLDVRVAKDSEHPKEPRWRERFSLARLARKRDAATRYLQSGLQRLSGRNRKWALTGLSAAVICVFIILLVGFEGGRSVPPIFPEPARVEEPGITATERSDLPAAKGLETPLDPTISLTPVAQDTETAVPSAEGGGADVQPSEPVEDGSAIAGTEMDPGEARAVFADMPASSTETFLEIDDGVLPNDLQEEGQDQPVQDQAQYLDQDEIGVLLAKAEQSLSKNRLTVPSEDNAYAYYGAVLARDPENAQARAGMDRIVQRYRQLARERLNRGDWRRARRFASRGLKISPQDQELRTIERRATRSRVARRTRNAPRVPAPLKRIERWFRSGNTNDSAFLDP